MKIDDESAFAWWVKYAQKKREIILSRVKSKYWQQTHKCGIRSTKSVKEDYALDEENKNKLWRKGIEEDMEKVKTAVSESKTSTENLFRYQEIDLYTIFDIKLGENFRQKYRLVAGTHKKKAPSSMTYSLVVSRDSARICLLTAVLSNLYLQSAYIENANLTDTCL